MNPKPWLATYRENGIAESVNADAYPSVVHMLDEAMQRYADQPAFRAFGQTLSFADVDRQSAAFAAWLQQRLGVKKGDRIAVMLPNLLAFPIACIGILRAGAVQVNVNPLYTPRELEHQLQDSGSETLVIFNGSTPTLAEVAAQAGIKTVITVAPGDGTGAALPAPPVDRAAGGQHRAWPMRLREGASMTRTPVALSGDDLIFLQYTGGTTGLSKGAALSHRNLVANVEQFKATMPSAVRPGQEVIVTAIPLYHIFALMVNFLTYFSAGAESWLVANPRDMDGFVETLKQVEAHRLHGRQHAVRRPGDAPEDPRGRFLAPAPGRRRRCGRGGRASPTVERDHRPVHPRGLRPVGNQPGAVVQPGVHPGVFRHHRPALARHRHQAARRRGP
jgi:long-chain acyl-CoA synthetase